MRNETHQVKSGNPYMKPYLEEEQREALKAFDNIKKSKPTHPDKTEEL